MLEITPLVLFVFYFTLLVSWKKCQGERSEIGCHEDGPAEVGRAEVGRAEVGPPEVSPAEVGLTEVGPKEGGPKEGDLAEVGLAEVGPSQRCLWPPHLFQISLHQVGMIELNTCCIERRWLSLLLIASQWKSLFEHHN